MSFVTRLAPLPRILSSAAVLLALGAPISTLAQTAAAQGRAPAGAPALPSASAPASAGSALGAPQLLPVDQAAAVPDFFTFRAHLLLALAHRDVKALMAVVDPAIKNSFDGPGGVAEFRALWAPEAQDSRIWDTLTTLLTLGGSFGAGQSTFVAPYTYSAWPRDLPAYGKVAIIGSNVRLRTAPQPRSGSLGNISFAVLEEVTPKQPLKDLVAVRLPQGAVVYVDRQYARARTDYRATFERVGNTWKMVKLINGD